MADPDPRNFLDVTVTKDKRYILFNCNSKQRSSVAVLDARAPCAAHAYLLRDADFTYFVEVRARNNAAPFSEPVLGPWPHA